MSTLDTIVHPVYYRIVVRRDGNWYFTKGKPFINWFNAPWLSQKDLFSAFDTSMKQTANQLRLLTGGKPGFYLANILDKQYYYCGTGLDDVQAKLQELGICKPEPIDVM